MLSKIRPDHLRRVAVVYIRQSTTCLWRIPEIATIVRVVGSANSLDTACDYFPADGARGPVWQRSKPTKRSKFVLIAERIY